MKLLSFLLPTTSECRNREAPGDFAAGAGGTVASSRAAISSLVSFPLGLDRPSSEFLLVMFPPCLSFPRFGSRNGPYVNPPAGSHSASYGNRSWIPWDQEHWRELARQGPTWNPHFRLDF